MDKDKQKMEVDSYSITPEQKSYIRNIANKRNEHKSVIMREILHDYMMKSKK